jgi:peptide alpha-N-acetyltransferase
MEGQDNAAAVASPAPAQPVFESVAKPVQRNDGIVLRAYQSLEDMKPIVEMMERDLSGEATVRACRGVLKLVLEEPYSIFTYRYFMLDWPDLTWLAMDGARVVGSVVCELKERKKRLRGYVAMLSVDPAYRRRGIARDLVLQSLRVMKEAGCHMATLETEAVNVTATSLYTQLGFQKDKLLLRYYLNGGDAWRLKLMFKNPYDR